MAATASQGWPKGNKRKKGRKLRSNSKVPTRGSVQAVPGSRGCRGGTVLIDSEELPSPREAILDSRLWTLREPKNIYVHLSLANYYYLLFFLYSFSTTSFSIPLFFSLISTSSYLPHRHDFPLTKIHLRNRCIYPIYNDESISQLLRITFYRHCIRRRRRRRDARNCEQKTFNEWVQLKFYSLHRIVIQYFYI